MRRHSSDKAHHQRIFSIGSNRATGGVLAHIDPISQPYIPFIKVMFIERVSSVRKQNFINQVSLTASTYMTLFVRVVSLVLQGKEDPRYFAYN